MKFDAHRFPMLKDQASDRSDIGCPNSEAFQPQFARTLSVFAPKIGNGPKDESDGLLEQARQKGLCEGIEAGRKKGSALALKNMAPVVERFVDVHARLSDQIRQMAQTAASQSILISLALSERILGPDMRFTQEDLAPLIAGFQEVLAASYHIILHMSPFDLDSLRDAAQTNGVLLPSTTSEIVMAADPALSNGEILIEQCSAKPQSLVAQMGQSLTQVLDSLPYHHE